MQVQRRYYACRSCSAKQVPWDAWAGVGTRQMTEHVRKVLSIVGSDCSFDKASQRLKDLCHLQVSNDTIRRVCDEEGEGARRWLREAQEPAAAIQAASGHHEFYSDGTSVNTVDGWREMRITLVARRQAGTAAEPGQWDQRLLPEPGAKLAMCQIADCTRIGASWSGLRRRLKLEEAADLSVIADGAKWIWEQAQKRLPGPNTSWCVDVYHVSQHLHACAKAIQGEGPAARSWAAQRLSIALQHNGPALIRDLQRERAGETDPATQQALDALLGYLQDNADSLWYRQRLAEGKPIGSGQIEGCCKNVIGARLKLNAARWRIKRAERMGALRCLQYSGQTDAYWRQRAA